MKRKSCKSNWIVISFSIIASIAVAVLRYLKLLDFMGEWTTVFVGAIWFIAIWTIVFEIINIFSKISINKYLKNVPYGFNYNQELNIYRKIGTKSGEKKEKKKAITSEEEGSGNKEGTSENNGETPRSIPLVYSVWKEELNKAHAVLQNNENFYRFLKRTLRSKKTEYDITIAVVTPIELAIMTFAVTNMPGFLESFVILIGTAIFLVIFLTVDLNKIRQEIEFIDDVCEIIVPDCMKESILRE